MTLDDVRTRWLNAADCEWYANDRHREVGRMLVAAISGQGPK
jgi:hypothetical protein